MVEIYIAKIPYRWATFIPLDNLKMPVRGLTNARE